MVARRCKREEQDGGEDERRRGRAVGEEEKKEKTAKVGEKRSTDRQKQKKTALCFSSSPAFPFRITAELQFHHRLILARHSRRENRQRQTMEKEAHREVEL